MRAAVTSMTGTVSASSTTTCTSEAFGVLLDPCPDGVGVGEEQPALDPEDLHALLFLVLRMLLDVGELVVPPGTLPSTAILGREAR